MNKLIISFDNVSSQQISKALHVINKAPIWGIKVKPTTLTEYPSLGAFIREYYNLRLMIDAKLYDTHDSIEDQLRYYVDILKANLVTVHLSAQFEPRDKTLLNNLAGVTILTTFDDGTCIRVYKTGVLKSIENFVIDANYFGYKNLICSANDLTYFKENYANIMPSFRIICPGIRPAWYAKVDDQKRVSTPKAALEAGADLLIIGRPFMQYINEPKKMLGAINRTVEEINT